MNQTGNRKISEEKIWRFGMDAWIGIVMLLGGALIATVLGISLGWLGVAIGIFLFL